MTTIRLILSFLVVKRKAKFKSTWHRPDDRRLWIFLVLKEVAM